MMYSIIARMTEAVISAPARLYPILSFRFLGILGMRQSYTKRILSEVVSSWFRPLDYRRVSMLTSQYASRANIV